jgi:hypothetical protein
MLRNAISFTIATVQVIALGFIALPLAGCGADGQGGPVISSLPPSTDTPSGESSSSDADMNAKESSGEEGDTVTSNEAATASAAEDFEPATIAEPADGEEDPTISVTSTPTGATAQLTWDTSPDPTVSTYYVYYGKQSSGEPGLCSYEASQSVETPPATITGLEPNTPYFFSISAVGESESPCSNEVLVVTPPAQS